MSHFTPVATKKLLSKASLCVMPETALRFTHLVRPVCYSGSVCALGGILLSFYYLFLRKLTIAIGRNGSPGLIGQLSVEVWFSKPPLIAAMLVSKTLFLNICLTLVLLLVINQLTR
jgi:hypothetical protein